MKPDEKLGPYELVSPIGKGGMGEVWRARDPRLKREVAIKVSAQAADLDGGRHLPALAHGRQGVVLCLGGQPPDGGGSGGERRGFRGGKSRRLVRAVERAWRYDVSADGQRFLAILPSEGDSGDPLTVVQNWKAGLKEIAAKIFSFQGTSGRREGAPGLKPNSKQENNGSGGRFQHFAPVIGIGFDLRGGWMRDFGGGFGLIFDFRNAALSRNFLPECRVIAQGRDVSGSLNDRLEGLLTEATAALGRASEYRAVTPNGISIRRTVLNALSNLAKSCPAESRRFQPQDGE
jgi:hypothetical protein